MFFRILEIEFLFLLYSKNCEIVCNLTFSCSKLYDFLIIVLNVITWSISIILDFKFLNFGERSRVSSLLSDEQLKQ